MKKLLSVVTTDIAAMLRQIWPAHAAASSAAAAGCKCNRCCYLASARVEKRRRRGTELGVGVVKLHL